MEKGPAGRGWLERLAKEVPGGQLARYLAVGIWNTVFGYGLFAYANYLLTGRVPYPYMAASAVSNVLSITVAYLGYKFFVFRTKGNYLREYLRCFTVYGTGMLVSLLLLPPAVAIGNAMLPDKRYSPYLAAAAITAGNVVLSFVGHRRFSFRA